MRDWQPGATIFRVAQVQRKPLVCVPINAMTERAMTVEATNIQVTINERDNVTAMLYSAAKSNRKRITLILGHGAGANQLHPFMQVFAKGLAARGLDVLTFNFVYMEQGRRVPDPKPKLEACYRAVITAAQTHAKLKGNRIAIGGKSMGGRIASQVAAAIETDSSPGNLAPNSISGLVFLGYPLHPPGNPEKLRDAHLNQIKSPMLFVQGSRDAFGTGDEIRNVIKRLKLPATLAAVEGGDHSLKVPKSSGLTQQQVYDSTMDNILLWLAAELAS
jgi:predicted alpha/beta-hydrolase family hydrolase